MKDGTGWLDIVFAKAAIGECVPLRAAWRNQERSIQPTPCAQIEQPWILRPLPRRHVSRSQPGCRQPRKLREGSFQADRGAGAEASRLEPPRSVERRVG